MASQKGRPKELVSRVWLKKVKVIESSVTNPLLELQLLLGSC